MKDTDNKDRIRQVLICEDDQVTLSLLERMISNMDYDVIKTDCAKDALDIISSKDIDAVILDIMLPDLDGYEVCKKIKQDKSTRYTTVITLSSLQENEAFKKSLESGSDCFIRKPVNKDELAIRLETYIELNEAKRSEQESKESYFELITHIDEGVCVYEPIEDGKDFIITYLNPKGEKITNSRIEDIKGKKVSEVFPGVKEIGLFDILKEVYQTKEPRHLSARLYDKDGLSFWAENEVYNLSDEKIVAIFDDLTKEVKANQDLIESERRFRRFFEMSNDAIFIHDIKGIIYDVNQKACDMLGYDKDILKSMTISQLHPKAYQDEANEHLREITQKDHIRFESVFISSDNNEIDIEVNANIIDPKNNLIEGIARDISKRKQAQELLKQNQKKLENILKAVPCGISELDNKGNILFVNSAYKNLTGYDPEEIIGNPVSMFSKDEKDAKKLMNLISLLVRRKPKPATWKGINKKKDGSLINVSVDWSYNTDKEGNVTGFVTSVTDITETQKAQEQIIQSEERYRSLFKNNPLEIIVVDDQGKIIDYNKAKKDSGDRIPNMGDEMYLDYASKHSIDMRKELMQCIKDKKPRSFEELKYLDRFFNIKINPLDHGAIISSQDITEKKHMEKTLRHSEKMSAIGQLAGGIAHDFNNALTGIKGYADLLLNNEDMDPKKGLNSIYKSASRAESLIKQLLAFSRKDDNPKNKVNLNDIIDEAISLLHHSIDKRIDISKQYDHLESYVLADKNNLLNAIMNLGINASHAMPDGGILSFKTSFSDIKEPMKTFDSTIIPGNYVLLEIKDTGTGIPKDMIPKIFEPFYTTKETGKGSGLGLAAVYGCVQSHESYIDLETKLGKGTTFKIYIPYFNNNDDDKEYEKQDMVYKGTGNILIIDDEEIVRDVGKDTLTNLGYNVQAIGSSQKAVEFYKDNHKDIDLILLDINMPGMNGFQTLDKIKDIDPQSKVIFMTGFKVNPQEELKDLDIPKVYIEKPFDQATISSIVKMYI